jgi:hypothetical protein
VATVPAHRSARLNVILARGAPVGVVFRRGPSRQVQVIKWQTDTDCFEPGQWFKGRIYDYRADLSSDGRYLVYFAAKHKPPLYSWTAVSRPPFLTALALWPKGDCWDGGGMFESPTRLWLNHPAEQAELAADMTLPAGLKVHAERGGGEDQPIWFRRLGWGGWEQLSPGDFEFAGIMQGYRTHAPIVWRRTRPCSRSARVPNAGDELAIELQMRISMRRYRRIIEFELVTAADHRVPFVAEWADWDQAGRLVLARAGTIRTADMQADETLIERQLADFSPNRFEEIIAPDWARRW